MTAPVRRPDTRGELRAGGAPDQGASGRVPLAERLALRNWSLPVKLAAVLLVPTLFVISLGVLRIVEQTEKAQSYDGVQQAVALEGDSARLVAALDGERRAAAVFLATNRAGGFGPVQERVDETSDTFGRLRSTYESASSIDDQTRSAYRDASAAVGQLDRVRGDVQSGGVDPAGAISRYTDATTAVLTFDESLTREAADPSIAGLSNGLYALSEVREQDAYVQAVVASAIAGGRIDAPSIDQARNATLRRSIAVDEFRSAVGTDNAGQADAVVGPDVDARDRLAQVVLGRGSAGLPLQVPPQDWDNASVTVQQKVTEVSDQLRGRLQANATSLQDGARNAAGVASVVLLLALMAGAAVVFFVTRSLLRPLRLLRRTALDVAERRLPAAVRSLREGEAPDTEVGRTPIETREEIGEVARAFDQVHAQAVRLAAEQAGLRTAFNNIFINLSRRSQALVERQLRLIEQLENKEEDPEALAELFQLDHLATRMRRNSENLLVLSGTDLARRGGRPVPLVDVLRAAVSEVEQYQRVEMTSPPPVQLLGRTAADVVHLVAELLENAAAFSAPDTRVDVGTRPEPDGAVVVEIADRGVGMTEKDLAEANQRLGSPPTVDVSASRRMGLFVVGRLAIRHGISVTLRTRDEDGGVVAAVRIPAAAVLSSGPGDRAVGSPQSARALGGTGLPVRSPGQSRPGLPASTANGSPRPETAGTPIPRQEQREGDGEGAGELPRRTGSRGGAAAAGAAATGAAAAGAAGAAAFFSPTVDPDGDGSSARAVGPGSVAETEQTPQHNGRAASSLPRRPLRPAPGAADDGSERAGPPPGPAQPPAAPQGSGEHAGPDIDDAGDDEDDRVASVVGDGAAGDDDGVTVWSQSGEDAADTPAGEPTASRSELPTTTQAVSATPPPDAPAASRPPGAAVPIRTVAAPAWRDADGRIVEDSEDAAAGDEDDPENAAPAGRHGMLVPPSAPGAHSGGPAPSSSPIVRPDQRSAPGQASSGPGARPGPPSHPGLRTHPGPAAGTAAQGFPPPPAAPDGGFEQRSSGPVPADRPPSASSTPVPPMWNGAEIVPPPEATAGASAESAAGTADPATEAASYVSDARPATPDGLAGRVGAQPASEEPTEEPAPGPSRPSLRPLSQRRRAEGGPALRLGSAPRLRPRRSPDAEGGRSTDAEGDRSTDAEGDRSPDAEGGRSPDAGLAGTSATGDEAMGPAEPSGTAGGTDPGIGFDPRTANGAVPRRDAPPGDTAGQNGVAAPDGAHRNGVQHNGSHPDGSHPGAGDPGAGERHGGHDDGNRRSGRGVPGPTRAGPEDMRRRPRGVLPNRERTPIFDEVASVWFREAGADDAGGVDPEWADGAHRGFDPGVASGRRVDAGTTESGLPRRRPRAQLVPGSAPVSEDPAQAPGGAAPRRTPDAVRGRLASYQRGVTGGRSTRAPEPPDDPAGGDPTTGPSRQAGPRTDEEEQ